MDNRSVSPSMRRPTNSEAVVMIGDYRRLNDIGKGSFAMVYRGIHAKKSKLVAIKSVHIAKLSRKLQENLLSEVRILQELHHPHIVSLFDFRETKTHAHLVMEFCELGDLSSFIRKRATLGDHELTGDMIRKYPNPPVGGLNEVVTRHFLKQIASGLQWIRKRNFLHRDIKPQNLLLVPSLLWREAHKDSRQPLMVDEHITEAPSGILSLPMLKIADFGFARYLSSIQLADTLCGSPLYMAPEILRYEKYDAKADLWSTGTVLYEMVMGKPPFRASNHVELIAKIDKNNDKIRFGEGIQVSTSMKDIIRGLLKKNPTERISYENFFAHPIVTEEIPGLAAEDDTKPRERKADKAPEAATPEPRSPRLRQASLSSQPQSSAGRRLSSGMEAQSKGKERRPTLSGHTPPRMERFNEVETSPVSSQLKEQLDRDRGRISREEKAAQDIAFERDYVVVEKKAVEVNAFADELEHSPAVRAHHQGALVRRTASSAVPYSTTAPQTSSRPWPTSKQQLSTQQHARQRSLEKQLYGRSPTSASSAITKALNMATFRVLGLGGSPPSKHMPTAAGYSPFPSYPTSQGTLLISDGATKGVDSRDEDMRILSLAEKLALRSDVVSSFAEIKYQQLLPIRPINATAISDGAAERIPEEPEEDDLPVETIVVIAEEALVLYVHALSILARVFDVTGTWFYHKRSTDLESSPRSVPVRSTVPVTAKVNSIVQWSRNKFNECLEKSEFVARKLVDAQKKLPTDHPGHPSNHPTPSASSSITTTSVGGSSVDNINLTSGVTAERLMYDRALEMSRLTAINELTNTDLEGGEVNYFTAVQMLEAVLDDGEVDALGRKVVTPADYTNNDVKTIDGLEKEDRKVVADVLKQVQKRLRTLRQKIKAQKAQASQRRLSGPQRLSPGTSPLNPRSSPKD